MVPYAATEFDVIIIGAGSGNSLLTPDYDNLRVAIVEKDIFCGTCLNRGCIPTKILVYTADVAMHIANAAKFGIDATIDKVRWTDIRDRVFDRIDPIPPSGKAYRESLRKIPNQSVNDPWGSVRGADATAARPTAAKTPKAIQAKRQTKTVGATN